MKKTIFVLILIIIILILLVGIIVYFFIKIPAELEPEVIINQPKEPTNINQPPLTEEEKARQETEEKNKYLQDIKNLELPYAAYYYLMELYVFCNIKNNTNAILDECNSVFNNHFPGSTNRRYCQKKVGVFAAMNFMKKNDKDRFLEICEENKVVQPKTPDCEDLWLSGIYAAESYCDNVQDDTCFAITSEDEKERCSKVINLKEARLEDLTSQSCKNNLSLYLIENLSDCSLIEDDLTRFVCLDLNGNNEICKDIKNAVESRKINQFIEKYKLNQCCYEGFTDSQYATDIIYLKEE